MANTVYFDPVVGGTGLTVTDDGNPITGLDNDGHRERLVPAFSNVVLVAQHVVDTAEDVNADAVASAAAAATATAQAGIATTKAGEVVASANNAANSATLASGSATSAAASATTATTKANDASASATSASNSATAASNSAIAAGVSANNAANSAAAANNSATTAANQASIATTKADEASTSATAASGSATAASNSATSASSSATAASNSADEAEYWAEQASAAATGGVKVSSTDTTAGTLDVKLVAGSNVTLTKLNAGGNETYRIDGIAVPAGDGLTQSPPNAFLGSSAFVDIGSMPVNVWPVLVPTARTVSIHDNAKTLIVSGTTTVTLPLAADVFGREIPFSVTVKARTGATITVARSGTDTIETVNGNKTMAANTALTFFPISATEWETR